MLVGERFKLRDDPLELPEGGISELMDIYSHKYKPSKLHSPPLLYIIILVHGRGQDAGERMHPPLYFLDILCIIRCLLERER